MDYIGTEVERQQSSDTIRPSKRHVESLGGLYSKIESREASGTVWGGEAAPESRLPAPDASGSYPPTLIGGLVHSNQARTMDFLTLTVARSGSLKLWARTKHHEAGYGKRGFEASEQRDCLGGRCWRFWKPFQESKRFGEGYETWEWSGAASHVAGMECRTLDCRPSRVDLAWDFHCSDDLTPEDLMEAYQEHAKRKNITLGVRGQGGKNTRYVGAIKSVRQIRIYRRDWHHPEQYRTIGPTMRVELILRDEQAHSFWGVWKSNTNEAFQVGAQHVYQMTGLLVQRDRAEIPAAELRTDLEQRQKLDQFLIQHGTTLAALFDLGIDVKALVYYHESKHTDRKRRGRREKKREAMEAAALPDILEWEAMMRQEREEAQAGDEAPLTA